MTSRRSASHPTPRSRAARRAASVATFLAVALAAGCATQAGSWPKPDPSRVTTLSAPKAQIVVQMLQGTGGPLPPGRALGLRPEVTIYGDGTAFGTPRTDENRNDPGTPVAFVRGHVRLDVLRAMIRDADRMRLFAGLDYGRAIMPGAGGTSLRLRPAGGPAQTVEVYALNNTDADVGLNRDQQAHRRALRSFTDRLYRAVELPAGSPPRWTPTRVDVTSAPAGYADRPRTSWPGPPVTTLLHESARGRCGVLEGAEAQRVWTAARSHGSTAWSVGDLVIRALLPGEPGCR